MFWRWYELKTTSQLCFLLVARGSHSKLAKSWVVLVVLSVILMLQQPASVLLQCPSLMFYPDSPIQSMHIPTFVGRISALMSRDDSCTFPLRNPCLDQAFPVIEATCCLNIRSSSTSTPKNFFCFVHGMMVNGCSDGVHFLENRICLHFVALNNMSHFCSHCSSMVKSSWRASMFAELLYRMVSTCSLLWLHQLCYH